MYTFVLPIYGPLEHRISDLLIYAVLSFFKVSTYKFVPLFDRFKVDQFVFACSK